MKRLDQLLGGGLPQGTLTLLFGGPFTGKGVLERLHVVEGLCTGEPGIFVLTDSDPYEMDLHLSRVEPGTRAQAQRGLLTYIDVYSRTVGAPEGHPMAMYLDGCNDLEDLHKAVQQQQQRLQKLGHKSYRLVIQSASTLLIESGARNVFKFLRDLATLLKRTGGTALFVLEQGMHPEAEVETIKYLAAGVIQTKELDDKFFLRVEGFHASNRPVWVQYEFSPTNLHLSHGVVAERPLSA